MMKAYTERMNQQREQEALLAAQREQELHEQEQAAQREQELLAQKQAAQEKEEPPQNTNFHCRQKELYCMHNDVEDLIENALNFKLLSINLKSQRLDKEKQEVKNIVEQAPKRRTQIADTMLESLSLSLSPIPFEDSDSHMEEIDLFLATDDLMPRGIENDDYDSEGDIYFLEGLLSNDPLPLPKNESSNFDHHDDPSFPRPPPKPPNVEVFFDFEPDTGVLTAKVDKATSDFSENPMLMYGGDILLLDVPYLHFYLLDQAQ
nr:hypothetical protein [Tanacetum cinerariifolium]